MRRQTIAFLLLQLTFKLSSCTQIQMMQGSSVELPCFHSGSDFAEGNITWKFNGNDINPTGESSGSVKVIKNGLFLSLSPVTSAHNGKYLCLVKKNNEEMIKIYDLVVDGSLRYTITVAEGSDVTLPCFFPPSQRITTNALWFKETGDGKKTRLNLEDDSIHEKKVELLYGLDPEQTIILRRGAAEDAGVYICESAGGERLSTLNLVFEARPTTPPRSCQDFNEVWGPCQDENSRTAGPLLQESLTEFSMKLYSHLRAQEPSRNLLISPISISGFLSHLLLGARGDTRRAIERAICLPHDFQCLHSQMKKMKEEMAHSLQMGSRIYYNPEMHLSESFINQSIQYYEAEPVKLLADSGENIQMINNWVANQTKNKITNLIDHISPNAQLILINAVSFTGQWIVKFTKKSQKGHFTKFNGDLVKVPILYDSKYMATVTHVTELKARVARFALSGNSGLYVLLPNRNTLADLQQVEEKLTDAAVRRMVEQLAATSPQHIEVTLPQIKLECEPNMDLLIKKLGLVSLFEDANLCGLDSEGEAKLDQARHKAFLALTEQGVEAGAVTSFSFSRSHPNFSALRPFILLVWSDEAKVPLFIGRMTDP
ncbi:plasma protease C1 inhibitor [Cololabis saira]|uniref:plasma protease C1 inhibitor n=1 Tax=Cololabis saira TaxID=129043 RepID=UPI002AD3F46D|nr:plasma protease C1 inhibitor [Cololabis saira]